jgi:hypothetical protein
MHLLHLSHQVNPQNQLRLQFRLRQRSRSNQKILPRQLDQQNLLHHHVHLCRKRRADHSHRVSHFCHLLHQIRLDHSIHLCHLFLKHQVHLACPQQKR